MKNDWQIIKKYAKQYIDNILNNENEATPCE